MVRGVFQIAVIAVIAVIGKAIPIPRTRLREFRPAAFWALAVSDHAR
jgi:hypothetical protein